MYVIRLIIIINVIIIFTFDTPAAQSYKSFVTRQNNKVAIYLKQLVFEFSFIFKRRRELLNSRYITLIITTNIINITTTTITTLHKLFD
jgi:hypothetical protein